MVTSNLGSRTTEVVSRGATTFINGGHEDVNPISIVVTYEPAGGAQLPDTLHAVATASLRDEWASGSNERGAPYDRAIPLELTRTPDGQYRGTAELPLQGINGDTGSATSASRPSSGPTSGTPTATPATDRSSRAWTSATKS